MAFFNKQSKPTILALNESSPLVSCPATFQAQIAMLHLTKEDYELVQSFVPLFVEHMEEITEQFYAALTKQPSLMALIRQHSEVARLKQTLAKHVKQMIEGPIDEQFLQIRQRIAQVHLRIGLEPKWYMAAFQHLYKTVCQLVFTVEPHKAFAFSQAFSKLINFEQQIVLEEYDKALEQLRQTNESLKAQIRREVTFTSNNLSSSFDQINASLQQLTGQSEVISQYTDSASQSTQTSERIARDGQTQLDEQTNYNEQLLMNLQKLSSEMNDLNKTTEEIQAITNLVKDVADQTSVLSLNAAIEAARAGEHGKGFAVVADEVRKLASRTRESADITSRLLDTLSGKTTNVAASIESFADQMDENSSQLNTVRNVYDQLVTQMSNIRQQNHLIDNEMKAFARVMHEISDAMEQASSSADHLVTLTNEMD